MMSSSNQKFLNDNFVEMLVKHFINVNNVYSYFATQVLY